MAKRKRLLTVGQFPRASRATPTFSDRTTVRYTAWERPMASTVRKTIVAELWP